MGKFCTKCDAYKDIDQFHKNVGNLDGHAYHCKACRKEESLKQYNLTFSDYDKMLEEQGGKCKICGTTEPRGQSKAGRFYVDHNHDTGKVRGLLCNDCNTGLGLFKDSKILLIDAIKYLEMEGTYDFRDN
tara:strand:+ start:96 stop:485 length:390 start_codon:yes stop_codon:yes gene_type:complete